MTAPIDAVVSRIETRINAINSRFGGVRPPVARTAEPDNTSFKNNLDSATSAQAAQQQYAQSAANMFGLQPGQHATRLPAGAYPTPYVNGIQPMGFAPPVHTGDGKIDDQIAHRQLPTDVPYAAHFANAGKTHGVPPALLAAVGWVESRYDPTAVSSTGAIGVMQIMPDTAQALGVDPRDPAQAIDGAARYLKQNFDRFGSWDLSVSSYFSGPGAVARNGNQAPPRGANYADLVHKRLVSQ